MAIAEQHEIKDETAANLNALGSVCLALGHIGDSKDYYECALEIAGRVGDTFRQTNCFRQLAEIDRLQGRSHEAQDKLQQCLELDPENRPAVCRTKARLGELFLDMEDLNQASDKLQEAEELARDMGDFPQLGRIWADQSRLALEKSDKLQDAEECIRTVGDPGQVGPELENQRQNAIKQAEERALEAQKIAEGVEDRTLMAYVKHLLGLCAHKLGVLTSAEGLYRESLDIADSIKSKYWMAWNHYALGKVDRERGDSEAAVAHWQKALCAAQSLGMPLVQRLEALALEAYRSGVVTEAQV
ncbi:tetratricopeptide repeat protein [Candidatus Poribacteria bacterium]|nr:tetratricopeptide repeat protein [Candidatus Poribacteria bacterium]